MRSPDPRRIGRLPGALVRRVVARTRSAWLGRGLAGRGSGVVIGPGVEIIGAPRIRLESGVRVLRGAQLWATERGSIEVGPRTYVGSHSFIVANDAVRIGADVLIAPFCYIQDTDHGFEDPSTPINRQPSRSTAIVIEDDVWLGAHTVVTRGVRIGRGAVIGAGSVVTRDIPPGTIAVGVPARPIRARPGQAANSSASGSDAADPSAGEGGGPGTSAG